MSSHVELRPAPLSLSPAGHLVALLFAIAALVVAGREALAYMYEVWMTRQEYSHGLLIPFISAFLVWQRRDELTRTGLSGSWAGVPLVLGGIALMVAGKLAALYVIQQYGWLIALYGLVLSLVGWRTFRLLLVPLVILLFMIPLPDFLLNNLSARLQLLSSQIGVAVVRLFGISVYLEGNVIDLGSYQLQVAEACSGLRYLFPLMTLGFIMAYFFKAAFWKRALLFLSTIPITVLMNSLRIGLIGVTVERWGIAMAEGFLHDFEGWVVFMASAAVLLLEIVLLSRIGRGRRHWRDVFAIELPARGSWRHSSKPLPLQPSFVGAGALLGVFAFTVLLLPERAEAQPQRASFSEFPTRIGQWQGRREALEDIYLDALKLDDYVLANYSRGDANQVNFYSAWYDSQRSGQSAHSPRSCLPGGGWRIQSLDEVTLPDVNVDGAPLRVNRALIQLGPQQQVVYYWFQQRGRVVTNEYLVKWFIFWDALTRNRTDGALVRLSAPVASDAARTDAVLRDFMHGAAPLLTRYIPD